MENEKFVVTPELFNRPEGFYIVCKNQTEVEECLMQLHNMGLLWRSGKMLNKRGEVYFNEDRKMDALMKAKEMAEEADRLSRALMSFVVDRLQEDIENGDEDKDTTIALCLGNSPEWVRPEKQRSAPYTIGYYRVSDWHEEHPWILRTKRVLFSNCVFHAAGRQPAKEAIYGDEN